MEGVKGNDDTWFWPRVHGLMLVSYIFIKYTIPYTIYIHEESEETIEDCDNRKHHSKGGRAG